MSHRLSRRLNNATGQCPVVCLSHVDNDGTVARGVSTYRCFVVCPVVPSLFRPTGGGHFRYMTTLVHIRSISVCVFCSTTSVHAKYHFSTSLCRYLYIAREMFLYAEGLQILNGCLVCYVCAIERSCSWHQTLITALRSERESTSTNTSPLTSRLT